MPKIYAFDIDETIEVSNGPVTLQMMMDLRVQGHIVGLIGNWGLFVSKVPGWQHLVSFLSLGDRPKHVIMQQLEMYVPCEERILVGNTFGQDNGMGFIGQSHDSEEAQIAGWRFIREIDFANGAR